MLPRICGGNTRAILIVMGTLLGVAIDATPQPAASAEPTERKAWGTWLNRRTNDLPFKHYGMYESLEKYFRVAVLGKAPATTDVTKIIQETSAIDQDVADVKTYVTNLKVKVANLKVQLANRPKTIRAIDEQLASAGAQREQVAFEIASIDAKLQETQTSLSALDINQNAEVFNQRSGMHKKRHTLARKLDEWSGEITRLKTEKSKLLLVEGKIGSIENQIASLDNQTQRSTEYFMVSHRPLLLATVASVSVLFGFVLLFSRFRPDSAGGPLATLTALVHAIPVYVSACILYREYECVSIPVLSSPIITVTLFLVFFGTRLRTHNAGLPGTFRAAISTVAVIMLVTLATDVVPLLGEGFLPSEAGLVQVSGLVSFVLGTVWVMVWVAAASVVLGATEHVLFRVLGLTVATCVAVLLDGGGRVSGMKDGIALLLAVIGIFGLALTAVESVIPARSDRFSS